MLIIIELNQQVQVVKKQQLLKMLIEKLNMSLTKKVVVEAKEKLEHLLLQQSPLKLDIHQNSKDLQENLIM